LAHHLQAITLALAFGVPGAGADFSHKLHLQFLKDCTACHTSARTSTRAEDNLLPSADVCRKCHQGMTVRTTPTPTMVAKFNHAIHWKIVPGGCSGCHTGIAQSEKVTKDVFPKMEQCLVCHTKIDPTDSCALCHVVGPQLKPANHTADWVDRHTDEKIPKQGCWVCHGKNFTCQGCH
jgi:hypothetical protein